MIDILKNPLYNAILSGIIIYILITVTNKGDPVLGAILSSLPIGIFGLIAIIKRDSIQRFYIRSEIFTNLIIIIMWLTVNILITYIDDTNIIAGIAIIIWTILSIIFYIISKRYLVK